MKRVCTLLQRNLSKVLFIAISLSIFNFSSIEHVNAADGGVNTALLSTSLKGLAQSLAGPAKKAKRVVGKILSGLKALGHVFMDTPWDAVELRIGTDTFAFVHELDHDIENGYSKSMGTVDPMSVDLIWSFVEQYVPGKIKDYYEQLKQFSAEQMAQIDFVLLITNILKKRIPFLELQLYANRIMLKISQSIDEDASAKQAKKILSTMAMQGPAAFYDKVPSLMRGLFDKLKLPVVAEDVARFANWTKSPITARAWDVVNEARTKLKFSERTVAARKWIDLIEKEGMTYTQHDITELLYWLKIHAGEWAVKTVDTERDTLKPDLVKFYKDIEAALQKSGLGATKLSDEMKKQLSSSAQSINPAAEPPAPDLSALPAGAQPPAPVINNPVNTVLDFVVSVRSTIELNPHIVPLDWVNLSYPEVISTSKTNLDPRGLLDHMWNTFKRASHPGYMSLCGFASTGLNETKNSIFAIFNQLDRDINAAEKVFKDSAEGKPLAQAITDAQKKMTDIQKNVRKMNSDFSKACDAAADANEAAPEMPDDLKAAKDELKGAQDEFIKAKKDLRGAAANFAFTTMDEDMAAVAEGGKAEAVSAYDRMRKRFKEIQIMSSKFFTKGLQGCALILMGMGLPIADELDKIAEIAVDMNKPNIAPKFQSESAQIGLESLEAEAPGALGTEEGSAEEIPSLTGEEEAPIEEEPAEPVVPAKPVKAVANKAAPTKAPAAAPEETAAPEGEAAPAEEPATEPG